MRTAGSERRQAWLVLQRWLLLVFGLGLVGWFLWREVANAWFDYGPPRPPSLRDAGTQVPVFEPAPRFVPPPIESD